MICSVNDRSHSNYLYSISCATFLPVVPQIDCGTPFTCNLTPNLQLFFASRRRCGSIDQSSSLSLPSSRSSRLLPLVRLRGIFGIYLEFLELFRIYLEFAAQEYFIYKIVVRRQRHRDAVLNPFNQFILRQSTGWYVHHATKPVQTFQTFYKFLINIMVEIDSSPSIQFS